jgi:hypothetical protein
MILTQEFLTAAKVCVEGQQCAEDSNYIGLDYDEVLKDLIKRGLKDYAGWMINQKKTELYFRSNGSIFIMKYVVYDPTSGQNVKVETIEEAKILALESAKKVLAEHFPQVGKVLVNENGDETFLGTDPTITESFTVVEK